MDYLVIHLACILVLISTVLVFAIIYWQDKQRYFRYWFCFQIWNLVAGAFLLLYLFIVPWPIFNGLYQISYMVCAYFLLVGTCLVVDRPLPLIVKPLFWLFTLWAGAAIIIPWPLLITNLPAALGVCSAYLYTGWLLLHQQRVNGAGYYVAGAAFLLWGIHILDRPLFMNMPVLIPYSYVLAMVLGFTAGLGQLMIYFAVSRDAIIHQEKQFRLLADNARDILFRYQLVENRFEYISPSAKMLYGYSPEEHYQDPTLWYRIADLEYRGLIMGYLDKPETIPPSLEIRVHTRTGESIWLELTCVLITDSYQQPIAIEGIIRDITRRRIMEEQLRHLSLHDALTGLYNRSILEIMLPEADSLPGNQGGVIIGDLDGLKLVNDALGHMVGDQLLRSAARILSGRVMEGETIIRIGGDEFAILLPQASEARLAGLVADIYQDVAEYNYQNRNTPLSISLGYAVRKAGTDTFEELMREADHQMYREKLQRSRYIRSTLVKALAATLARRDFITEEHAERMEELVCELGKRVGLMESSWANLKLFSRFHDLGKVSIPDRILFKPGPLTIDETLEMQRHCEIGYRIAQSGPELNSIADWILKHHEWWNGQGYPLGLSGEEIPLECRVMALVDAYYAMIHDRPYRSTMSEEQALNEILQRSGSQFDPNIVPHFIDMVRVRDAS